MARPTEIQDAKTLSLRLPAALVRQYKEAAELRAARMTDLMRESLQVQAEVIYEVSYQIRAAQLQATIDAIQADYDLNQLFELNKESNEWKIPSTEEMSRRTRLIAALDADRALKRLNERRIELISSEKESFPILNDMKTDAQKSLIAGILPQLRPIIMSGDLSMRFEAAHGFILSVSAKLASLFSNDDEVQMPAANALKILISERKLILIENRRGSQEYRWHDKSFDGFGQIQAALNKKAGTSSASDAPSNTHHLE